MSEIFFYQTVKFPPEGKASEIREFREVNIEILVWFQIFPLGYLWNVFF